MPPLLRKRGLRGSTPGWPWLWRRAKRREGAGMGPVLGRWTGEIVGKAPNTREQRRPET